MNNYCINLKKRKNRPFCNLFNEEITFCRCQQCDNKKYKTKNKENLFYKSNNNQIKKEVTFKKKITKKTKISGLQSKRSKECDISDKVKKNVWERDGHKCVICGSYINVMPNAHFIPRSKGGLGTEKNIFTACTRLTDNDCHYRFDNGNKEEKEKLKEIVKKHFISIYPNWNEDDLYYKK